MPKQQETAVLHMTDLHYGKKTSSFGLSEFHNRLHRLSLGLERVKELLGEYDFDKLVIMLGGDVNDGTGIYKTQEHHQAETDVQKQAWELSKWLAAFLVHQKEVWGTVEVECVPGNHGRGGRFVHEAANWDVVCYNYLDLRLKDQGIPIRQNEDDNIFIRKVPIRGHNYLLYHGHDIRSYASIPWYGIMLRTIRWLSTTKLSPFDAVLMGHFHSFGQWKINSLDILMSGTMVTDDEWALQSLGWESTNIWHLFGVSNRYPITWNFGMHLNGEKE